MNIFNWFDAFMDCYTRLLCIATGALLKKDNMDSDNVRHIGRMYMYLALDAKQMLDIVKQQSYKPANLIHYGRMLICAE